MMKYPCPCCGYYTFKEKPTGTYYICPVCYWEDDDVQYEDANFRGGANEVSLNEAKVNFEKFGAIEHRYIPKVRKPTVEEIPKTQELLK